MKRVAILLITLNIFFTGYIHSQVPSYVPTSGLTGWWPFNGNANDESINGNNGVVTGATLTNDRLGNGNKAYSFNGSSNIKVSIPLGLAPVSSAYFSISLWLKSTNNNRARIIQYFTGTNPNVNVSNYDIIRSEQGCVLGTIGILNYPYSAVAEVCTPDTIIKNKWINLTVVFDQLFNKYTLYKDGVAWINGNIGSTYPSTGSLVIGAQINGLLGFLGDIDDVGIWNRALTQQEITTLYQGCSGFQANLNTTNLSVNTNSNGQFIASSNGSNPTYQWQTNPSNIGWQNIPNNTTYSGATTSNLSINNTQLSNHLQPFRVIVNEGNCKDTSDIALLKITDTCIATRYISVTDTLIINTTITGITPPNNKNTIKIYPNPTSSYIYINNGNFSLMNGYSIKIDNNLGQTVFNQSINQQQFYINTATWSGAGTYFVYIIDNNSNIIETRKIILQ